MWVALFRYLSRIGGALGYNSSPTHDVYILGAFKCKVILTKTDS